MSITPMSPAINQQGWVQTWVTSQWKNRPIPGQFSAEINSPNGAVDTDSSFLSLREITIRFERELAWPDLIKVGTLISSLGTSSIVMQQVIVSAGEVAATARVVNVLVSRSNRRSCPLPDKLRFALSAYQG